MNLKKYLDRAKIVLADAKSGRKYELGIADYEFPIPLEDKEDVHWDPEYDGNWLNMSFRVKDKDRDASCKDACILSWELEHLAEDLDSYLSNTEEEEYEPYFTENVLYLLFRRKADGRIKVKMEFSSEGKMSAEKKWERFRFEGIYAEKDIRKAVKALRLYAAAFPYRDFAGKEAENDK